MPLSGPLLGRRNALSCYPRIRAAELLAGELEVDESYLGGSRAGKRGRGALGKQIVAIAAEALPRGAIGRIRIARIPDCSEEVLTGFVQTVAEPGSAVYTASRHRGLVFYRLLQQAVQVDPVPYSRLVAPRS